MSANGELRELLFGDVPTAAWAGSGEGEPWATFRLADQRARAGDTAGAKAAFAAVLTMPELESRHYLQAWHGLRGIGIEPAEADAKRLYGVVLDVPMDAGMDTLAAYADGSCRYLNHAGGATIWERPDDSLDELVAALLAAAQPVVEAIGPWEEARPAVPPGEARLSLLAASGLHFGQARFEVLLQDQMAAPVFSAGIALLQALVDKTS